MPTVISEARHEAANLLYSYTEVADRKDVPAVVKLLGTADVEFPGWKAQGPAEVEAHFRRLWAAPEAHRHIVSNLIVECTADPEVFTGRALYTRWLFTPIPVMTTMGEYDIVIGSGSRWSIHSLRVSRSWQLEG